MATFPDDLKYTRDHEWVRAEDGECTVGITDFAAEQLGDVTYVEPPDTGAEVAMGDAVCAVESVKAASDIYAPVAGTVSEGNDALDEQPELVNQDPYGEGWFFKMTGVSAADIDSLMDVAAYALFVESLDA